MAEQLLQLLFSGLTIGSIYALIALCLVTLFNITGILNLAQGDFVAIGALSAASMVGAGMPLSLAFLVSVILAGLLGGVLERLAIYKAQGASGITMIIITIGLSISLRGLALLIWGTETYSMPPFTGGEPLRIGGAALNTQSIWIFAVALASMGLLWLFFEKTYAGKAVKASMINRTGAKLQGIDPQTISLLAFAASGALGAAAGICIAPVTMATYDMGFMLGVKGFVAAVAGGMGNIAGAVLGGLVLGILESYGAGLISSNLKDAIAIVALLLLLFFRPQGMIGFKRQRGI